MEEGSCSSQTASEEPKKVIKVENDVQINGKIFETGGDDDDFDDSSSSSSVDTLDLNCTGAEKELLDSFMEVVIVKTEAGLEDDKAEEQQEEGGAAKEGEQFTNCGSNGIDSEVNCQGPGEAESQVVSNGLERGTRLHLDKLIEINGAKSKCDCGERNESDNLTCNNGGKSNCDCDCAKKNTVLEKRTEKLENIILELSERNLELVDFIKVEFGEKFKAFQRNRFHLRKLGFGVGELKSVNEGEKVEDNSEEVVELLSLIREANKKTKKASKSARPSKPQISKPKSPMTGSCQSSPPVTRSENISSSQPQSIPKIVSNRIEEANEDMQLPQEVSFPLPPTYERPFGPQFNGPGLEQPWQGSQGPPPFQPYSITPQQPPPPPPWHGPYGPNPNPFSIQQPVGPPVFYDGPPTYSDNPWLNPPPPPGPELVARDPPLPPVFNNKRKLPEQSTATKPKKMCKTPASKIEPAASNYSKVGCSNNRNERRYRKKICPVCDQIVTNRKLRQHLLSKHKDVQILCPVSPCKKDCISVDALEIHITKHHNLPLEDYRNCLNTYQQQVNSLKSWLSPLLQSARMANSEAEAEVNLEEEDAKDIGNPSHGKSNKEEGKRFTPSSSKTDQPARISRGKVCPICELIVSGKMMLRHISSHTEVQIVCVVPTCKEKFDDSYSLKKHITGHPHNLPLDTFKNWVNTVYKPQLEPLRPWINSMLRQARFTTPEEQEEYVLRIQKRLDDEANEAKSLLTSEQVADEKLCEEDDA